MKRSESFPRKSFLFETPSSNGQRSASLTAIIIGLTLLVATLMGCHGFAAKQKRIGRGTQVALEAYREQTVLAELRGSLTRQELEAWWNGAHARALLAHRAFIESIFAYERVADALKAGGTPDMPEAEAKRAVLDAVTKLTSSVLAARRAGEALGVSYGGGNE
jgi:hypothetical protein